MSTPADDRDAWNRIADHWDESVGEGNDFQKELVWPTTDALLAPTRGMKILDACCGNGNYARRLGRLGCDVIAFDGSGALLDHARRRTHPSDGSIAYHLLNACDASELQTLDPLGPFDAVVCSMAMMDLPTLDPLLRAFARTLRPHAPIVASIGHPAFFTNESIKWATQDDGQGQPVQSFGCLVTRYLSPWPHPSRGLLDQPVPHTMWHRSTSDFLRAFFDAGLVIDALEEPAFSPDRRMRSPFSWARRPEIPPVLVVRARLQRLTA